MLLSLLGLPILQLVCIWPIAFSRGQCAELGLQRCMAEDSRCDEEVVSAMQLRLATTTLSPSLPAVPSLEELSGDWQEVSPSENCTVDGHELCRDSPVISNFWGSVGTSRDDVFSINSLTLAPFVGGNFSGTALVGGAAFGPGLQRWSAYEALRRSVPASDQVHTRSGRRLKEAVLETSVRMGFEKNVVLWSLRVNASDSDLCPTSPDVEVSLLLAGLVRKLKALPWVFDYPFDPRNFTALVVPAGLIFQDKSSAALAGFAVAASSSSTHCSAPVYTAHTNGTGSAQVYLRLEPNTSINGSGCSGSMGLAMVVGDRIDQIQSELADVRDAFQPLWHEARDAWQERWKSAFVPPEDRQDALKLAGTRFSGSLPMLETGNTKLRRLYYTSCLTLLSLMRWTPALTSQACPVTQTAAGNYCEFRFNADLPTSPVLYTEIGGAGQFYWDTSFHALLSAMLDPAGMRNQTLAVLRANIDKTNWIDLMTMEPGGQRYSFNDYTVFETVQAVASLDPSFLGEPTPQGTVADALRALATKWRALRMEGHPCTADYGGDRNDFLEAVPTYIHAVPALQAANVFMLRAAAQLASTTSEDAQQMHEEADCIAKSLFENQFDEGGFWCSLYPAVEGVKNECVPVRTCIDLLTIARSLRSHEFEVGGLGVSGPRPNPAERMTSFARRELMTPTWLRALSREGEPAYVDRPDHGTTGAYPAWPAGVAEALAVLDGNWSGALRYLEAIGSDAGVASHGPFGQASELEVPNATDPAHAGGAFKTARGATRFLADAGGAFAEVIVRSVFGYDPSAALTGSLPGPAHNSWDDLFYRPQQPRSNLHATLRNVRLPGGKAHVTIETHPGQGLVLKRQ